MVNKVILIGNVGKDPETRYLEGGATVTRFPLATSEVYKNKAGEKIENPWRRSLVSQPSSQEVPGRQEKQNQSNDVGPDQIRRAVDRL